LHVKKVEIHGFKSFPDKTTLELTPGITVVVGPNGCGKSNISDAIRWVLGEQSARYLRGTRMDDIIFSGTANRKPLSFAEVSATLDNSDNRLSIDYQEVTVTRRIYRNGDSEYLLNRRPCRLRDIAELFMDTGIGKEAYSFIGQGRVEEILNARPEERRQIFEEAAGILKYKNRKREAERRLAETAENLLRVSDIIGELSGQLVPLSAQAQTARRYLDLRGELKLLEVNLMVHDATDMDRRLSELETRSTAARDELVEKQAAITKKEVDLAERQLALDAEQEELDRLQRELQNLTSGLEKVQGKIAVNAEKKKGLERQVELTLKSLAEEEAARSRVLAESEGTRQAMEAAALAVEETAGELDAAEAELAAAESSPEARRARECREELEAWLPGLRRLQSEYDRLCIETEQLAERGERLLPEQEDRCAKQAELEKNRSLLREEKKKIGFELSRFDRELTAQTAAREKLDLKVRDLEEKCLVSRKRSEDTEAEIKLLKQLDEAMAGYYQGVKTVLGAGADRLSGIIGTVADILRVPPTYVTAVEAALGPALQNLVTEDDSAAKQAIAFLKKTRGGRATFLPLNLLTRRRGEAVPPELTGFDGYLGTAADVVETEPRFAVVVDNLLSRVHLARDLEVAVPVAKALRFSDRVVTLEGDVVMPGGAMSGGADRRQGGVLSRRKERQKLEEELQSRRRELSLLERSLAEVKNLIPAVAEETARLEEARRQGQLSLSVLIREEELLAGQAESAAAALARLQAEADTLAVQLEESQEAMTKAAEELDRGQAGEGVLRRELARLQGMLDAQEQEKRSLRNRCTELRVRMARLQKQQEFREEETGRHTAELERSATRKKAREEEIRGYRTDILELAGRMEEDRDKTAVLEKYRSELLTGFLAREKAQKELATAQREEMEMLRQAEKELSSLERRQARTEMEREKAAMELQAVQDRLQNNWQLDFEAAKRLAQAVSDRAEVLEVAARAREEINALGTVNLGAVDEHKRVLERVEFLEGQRRDLLEGEKDLKRIIREIDGRMGEKFVASFAVINQKFEEVFKELFGGGRAQLRLTDPGNILETGIEIVAQPPGKKLQQLSLLSGGEKALTAIALLFAFLKVRPAPFCVLDEIETALDEANLAKFNEFLRKLSAGSQFILISHRKRTMEQANILYGVTMEESGISKIVSVRLRADDTGEATA
jgi:chromosome segregation protein